MLGETNSVVGQLLVTHLLYKVHSLFSTKRLSSGRNIQLTHFIYFSYFLWDQVFASQIKTEEEILLGETGQLLVNHLLYKVHFLIST